MIEILMDLMRGPASQRAATCRWHDENFARAALLDVPLPPWTAILCWDRGMIDGAHGPFVSGRPRGGRPSRVARPLGGDRRVLRRGARPRRAARARRRRDHPLHLLPGEPPAGGGARGPFPPDRCGSCDLLGARRTAARRAPAPLRGAAP